MMSIVVDCVSHSVCSVVECSTELTIYVGRRAKRDGVIVQKPLRKVRIGFPQRLCPEAEVTGNISSKFGLDSVVIQQALASSTLSAAQHRLED